MVRRTARRSAAADDLVEGASDGAFPLLVAAGFRGIGEDPVRETGERHALEIDGACSLEGGEKEPLTAKEHGLEVTRPLDVVGNAFGKSDEATGIDAQGIPREFATDDGPTGMEEGEAVTLEVLEDKAFTSEEAGAQLAVEGNADLRPEGGAKKSVFLAEDTAAGSGEVDGNNLAGVGRGEGDPPLLRAAIAEVGEEKRLPGKEAFPDTKERPEEATGVTGPVAHFRLKVDICLHVVHGPGFGNDGLRRIQLNFNKLHIVAHDMIIDHVTSHGKDMTEFFAGRQKKSKEGVLDAV